MIIDETKVQAAVSSEDFKKIAFRVDQKMAQIIFRDKLYTAESKLRVIPQEYMANARDAHRVSGKSDTPIEVTLPTSMNPEFIVRDFGNGIPPEIVEDIFVVYGASTKKGSNVENGGYGIGAKSAFSYVNAFSVTTTVKGTRYIYAATIDSDGMNQFTLMDQGPATGPDGTEIRVPIRANDMGTLKTWVTEITQRWNPRPIITNAKLEYKDVKPEYSGHGWDLYEKNVSPFSFRMFFAGITICVDDIPYTLTRAQAVEIGGVVDELHRWLCERQQQLVLAFKVGEVAVPPQRESIDVTPRSKKSIGAVCDAFVSHMVAEANKKIAAAEAGIDKVLIMLSPSIDVQLALKLGKPVECDMELLTKRIDADEAGMRIYEARYNRRVFHDLKTCTEIRMRGLLKPSDYTHNRVIVTTNGRKMQPSEMKAFIRRKCNLDYGDSLMLTVYDTSAFTKATGLEPKDLERISEFDVIDYVRPPRSTQYEAGHFFLRGLTVSFQDYRDTVVVYDSRKKYDELPTYEVYVDYEDGSPLFHGKPVTRTELGELVCLLSMLKTYGSSYSGSVKIWEERFEKRGASCSEFLFLEDALADAFAECLQGDLDRLRQLAFNGFSPYKPHPQWPLYDYSVGDTVETALMKSGVFSKLFTDRVQGVCRLEQLSIDASDDEKENSKKKFISKLNDMAEKMFGPDLRTACADAVKDSHDIRDELVRLMTSSPALTYVFALANGNSTFNMVVNGKTELVVMSDVLANLIKGYTPTNPLFRKTP